MKVFRITNAVGRVCLLAIVVLPAVTARAQDAEPDADAMALIVELLNNEDRDMRALGLQEIRESIPGEAATKAFIDLLPGLSIEVQGSLIEALGDRGDTAARPTIVEMVKNEQEVVRTAALRALGKLGTKDDVALLAAKAVAESKTESDAARQSLVKLRGDEVNATIVATLAEGEPSVRSQLLGVLAARNAKEALPKVIESVEDADSSVRLAALGALRFLAEPDQTATLVEVIKKSQNEAERLSAELALLVMCSRGREACADAVVVGLADAEAPVRVSLLRALARAGGERAMAETVARLEDEDPAVVDQAVRMLAASSDPAAVEHLKTIVQSSENRLHRVLAMRGLVRMSEPGEDKPADVETLALVMKSAERPQDKLLVIGALGAIVTPEALDLAASAVDDPELATEAGLAVVRIAEAMADGDKVKIGAAVDKIKENVKDQKIRDRARAIAESL